jgi:hypothetical protein
MFSSNAESRLHNLVQTIQRYKGDSGDNESGKNLSGSEEMSMMAFMYENFEKWQD